MKLRFLILAAVSPVMAIAQTPKVSTPAAAANFTMSGKIGNLNKPAKIYIDYMDQGTSYTDSVELVNGAFKFSGHIEGIVSSRMTLAREGGKEREIYGKGAGDVIYLSFGKENIKINSADSLFNAKFTGSKVHDDMLAYEKEVGESVMTTNRTANLQLERATPEQQKDTAFFKVIDKRVKGMRAAKKEKLIAYAKSHPNSYFALQALSEAVSGYSLPAPVAEPIFKNLSEELRLSYGGQSLYKILSAHTVAALGASAPNFTQNDVDGKPVSLSDYKGKLVLVEFWASWCHPCREESPNLLKQYSLYKEKGFEILSVSVDSDKGRWLEAIKKDGLTWRQVSDLKGWENEARKLYGISGVPANFLVSKDGKIIGSHLRGDALNKKLAEILD
ncbi:TlpA disulfide reductase family protein [Pedobacter metabolipauper]|uniref:Peroxiredoxin n=1 Tax=Pedobacter metabolipauper TaxID=425513 RepID=A0A4V3D0R9_9SPHI|nr:TlpA disulfide reductase family protein [Pedobacter metabolipauper]TDQ07128.1 peroxiredoxin [Pedobacter metabolipauper]